VKPKSEAQLKLQAERSLAHKLFAEEAKLAGCVGFKFSLGTDRDGRPIPASPAAAAKARDLAAQTGQELESALRQLAKGVCALVAGGKALRWALEEWQPGMTTRRGFAPAEGTRAAVLAAPKGSTAASFQNLPSADEQHADILRKNAEFKQRQAEQAARMPQYSFESLLAGVAHG
jgi:hypothetical protein